MKQKLKMAHSVFGPDFDVRSSPSQNSVVGDKNYAVSPNGNIYFNPEVDRGF